MKHPLKPLSAPFSEKLRQLLSSYPKAHDGKTLGLFRVFANSLRFLGGKGVVNLLDNESPLTLKERELVILRVTANLGCEYEWGVHVAGFAKTAGLSSEQVSATRLSDSDDPIWCEDDSALLHCIDNLCNTGRMTPDNLHRFQNIWNAEQQLEILALCGNYHTVCFVANNSELNREPWAPRFPT